MPLAISRDVEKGERVKSSGGRRATAVGSSGVDRRLLLLNGVQWKRWRNALDKRPFCKKHLVSNKLYNRKAGFAVLEKKNVFHDIMTTSSALECMNHHRKYTSLPNNVYRLPQQICST